MGSPTHTLSHQPMSGASRRDPAICGSPRALRHTMLRLGQMGSGVVNFAWDARIPTTGRRGTSLDHSLSGSDRQMPVRSVRWSSTAIAELVSRNR